MSLAPAPEGEAIPASSALEPGARVRGKVQRVERFGVFVWLGPGRVGLVPGAWTGTPRGADLFRQFPIGRDVEATVVEVAEGGRRIRLTMAPEATARSEAGQPARSDGRERESRRVAADRNPRPEAPQAQSPEPAFGTHLGDALKSAFERNRRGSS